MVTLTANECILLPKTDGADGVAYAGSGWARGGVCRKAWHASLFRLFCSHASGRAEGIVGLRTRRFADAAAEDDCSQRVAVWGAACIKALRPSRVHVRQREKESAAWRRLAGIYVALPWCARSRRRVVGGARRRSPIASASRSMHIAQRRGRPAAATNVMSANSDPGRLAVPPGEGRRDEAVRM